MYRVAVAAMLGSDSSSYSGMVHSQQESRLQGRDILPVWPRLNLKSVYPVTSDCDETIGYKCYRT